MKVELIPYDFNHPEEAQELFKIIQKYYQKSPWPPSVEKITNGGVKYYRAIFENQQFGISGIAFKTPSLAETVKTTVFIEFQG